LINKWIDLAFTITMMAKNAEPGRSYVLTDTILHWMPTIEIVYLKSATTFQMVFKPGDMAGSRRLISSCERLGTEPVIDKYRPQLLPKSGSFGTGRQGKFFRKSSLKIRWSTHVYQYMFSAANYKLQ
jgi:hypothetical protein